MPTYDYECGGCGASFEEFQSITAKPLRKCKQCGKNTLKRLIGSGAGVIFKGSGFYETDYRSESYKAGAKAEKDASGGKKDSDSAKASDTAGTKGDSKKKAGSTDTPKKSATA